MKNTGIIILAAGASRRLGSPKQLLPFHGRPLLQYIIDQVHPLRLDAGVLVLGAQAQAIQSAIQPGKLEVVINTGWEEGMASSIRIGLEFLLSVLPEMERVLIVLSDQPYVTPQLLEALLALHEQSGKKISGCQYVDVIGVPAVFSRTLFPGLLLLQGDRGACAFIKQNLKEVVSLSFEKGITDIDTVEDYEKLSFQCK